MDKGKYGNEDYFKSQRHDYMTPLKDVINPVLNFIGLEKFSLDVCCTKENIPAIKHNVEGTTNGLVADWLGICWLNPPYKTADKWIKKAVSEVKKHPNLTEIWGIIPARTETAYFQEFILKNPNAFCVFLQKGICFIDPVTEDYVKIWNEKKQCFEKGSYKNPLAIVYFGKNALQQAKKWYLEKPIPNGSVYYDFIFGMVQADKSTNASPLLAVEIARQCSREEQLRMEL